MTHKISLCGDNCSLCPRFTAQTEEQLQKVAELWHKVGWRDRVLSPQEMRCDGCGLHKQCTYQLVECAKEHSVQSCVQCADFPCPRIQAVLDRSQVHRKKCLAVCSNEEFRMLGQAFFQKEQYLCR